MHKFPEHNDHVNVERSTPSEDPQAHPLFQTRSSSGFTPLPSFKRTMLNIYRQLENEKGELFQKQITSDPAAKKSRKAPKEEKKEKTKHQSKTNFISNTTKIAKGNNTQIQEKLSDSWTVRQNRAMAKKSMMISAASAQVEKKKKKKLTSSQMTT